MVVVVVGGGGFFQYVLAFVVSVVVVIVSGCVGDVGSGLLPLLLWLMLVLMILSCL